MSEHQNDKLLKALQDGPLTGLQILDKLGIARAAARVHELRQAGHDIRSTPIEVRNRDGEACRVALYSLATQQRTLLPEGPGRGVMTAAAVSA